VKPTRLLDEDRFEAELLRTALSEEPTRGALSRAEAALGVGVGAGLTSVMTGTAKAAAAHAGADHTAAHAGVVSIVKWVGIGVVSSVVVTGGVRFAADPALRARVFREAVTSSATTESRAVASKRAKHVRAPVAKAVDVTAASSAEETTPVEAPSAQEPPLPDAPSAVATEAAGAVSSPSPSAVGVATAATSLPPRAVSAVARRASVTEELAVLERARRALRAELPGTALGELDLYWHMPSARVLGAEAELLGIEALLQQGNVSAARANAAAALRRAPGGPHAKRLQEIVALPDRR